MIDLVRQTVLEITRRGFPLCNPTVIELLMFTHTPNLWQLKDIPKRQYSCNVGLQLLVFIILKLFDDKS